MTPKQIVINDRVTGRPIATSRRSGYRSTSIVRCLELEDGTVVFETERLVMAFREDA